MPARVGERHCNGFGSQFSGSPRDKLDRNNLILPANQETASAIQHRGIANISINGKRTFKITREHFEWVRKLGTTRTRAYKEYKEQT